MGGGIYFDQPSGFTMTVTKSTISGNTAVANGGGLFLLTSSGGTIALGSSTVASNRAGTGGGIYSASPGGRYTISHVLLADNTATVGFDCAGYVLRSTDFNLLGSPVGCTFANQPTDIIGRNPLLGPLVNNGGPTVTHAIPKASPAFDAGDPTGLGCMGGGATDQRGFPQPARAACDIGAYEMQ